MKKTAFSFIALLLAVFLTGCNNSSNQASYEYELTGDIVVLKFSDAENLRLFLRTEDNTDAYLRERGGLIPLLKTESEAIYLEKYLYEAGDVAAYFNINGIQYRITTFADMTEGMIPSWNDPIAATVTVDGIDVNLYLHPSGTWFSGWFLVNNTYAHIIISTTDLDAVNTEYFYFEKATFAE